MENEFTFKFKETFRYNEVIETNRNADGYFFRARIEQDADMQEPWKEHDGHGIVSEWRPIESKTPGERALCTDRRSALFYDIQETTKLAKRDGWGCGIETHEHKTAKQQAACAVEQDFKRLRAWCNDEWYWVILILSLHHVDEEGTEETVKDYVECLGGIDGSDQTEYLTSEAAELLSEALANEEVKQFLSITESQALARIEEELETMEELPDNIAAHVVARLEALGFDIVKRKPH